MDSIKHLSEYRKDIRYLWFKVMSNKTKNFIFVEGTDDKIFYSRFFTYKKSIKIFTIDQINSSGGKKAVIKSKEILDFFKVSNATYIIDKDFDDINDLQKENKDNLFVTRGYSMENYVIYHYFIKNNDSRGKIKSYKIDDLVLIYNYCKKNVKIMNGEYKDNLNQILKLSKIEKITQNKNEIHFYILNVPGKMWCSWEKINIKTWDSIISSMKNEDVDIVSKIDEYFKSKIEK